MIASGLAAALLGGCFDFDATMAGGPLTDSGSDVPPEDASFTDATLPSDAGDAGDAKEEISDGSVTDAVSVPDSGSPYCASLALAQPDGGLFFCDDFDESASLGIWQSYDETAGTIVVTDASAVSPPNSVVETTTAVADGTAVNVALRTPEPLPTLPATMILAFWLEPVQIDTTANAAIVLGAVDFLDSAGDRYTVGLAINVVNGQPALALGEQSGLASGGNFPDGAPPVYVNHPLPQTELLPMNDWSDLVIEIDWTASSLEGKVTVNGGPQFDVPLTMTVVPSSLQIGIGTSFVTEYEGGLSPVWELRYDNVLFTAN